MADKSAAIDILVILIVSAALALAVAVDATTILDPDSASYIAPARHFLAGNGFNSDGKPVSFADSIPGYPNVPGADTLRTPVYPALIALFLATGAGLHALVAFQHVLNAAIAISLYLFLSSALRNAQRISGRAVALAAALLYAAFLPAAQVANEVLAETLSTALVLAVIVAAERTVRRQSPGLAVVCGLLLGVAVLTRPIALYFFVPIALVLLLFARRRVLLLVLFLASAQILPVAWTWRNYRASGVATLTTIPTENLLFQWAAAVHVTRHETALFRMTAAQQQLGFRSALHRARLPLFHQAMAIARANGADPVRLNAAQKSVYERDLAIRVLREHPLAVAELMVSGILELQLFAPAAALAQSSGGSLLPRPMTLFVVVMLIALLLAVAGVRLLHREHRALAWLVAATILYFMLTAAIPEATVRYTLVYAPMYAAAIAAGIAGANRSWRAQSSRASLLASNGPS